MRVSLPLAPQQMLPRALRMTLVLWHVAQQELLLALRWGLQVALVLALPRWVLCWVALLASVQWQLLQPGLLLAQRWLFRAEPQLAERLRLGQML